MIRSILGGSAALLGVLVLSYALACAVTRTVLEHQEGTPSPPATATTSAPRLTPISAGR